MNRNLIVLALTVLMSLPLCAQRSAVFEHDRGPFLKALERYGSGQFLAAQQLFEAAAQNGSDPLLQADCEFYRASCAVMLNQSNADALMEAFVENNPTSLKSNQASKKVADFYFDNGRYAYAQKWYERVDAYELSEEQRERYYFNNGYACFRNDRYAEAQKYFDRLQNSLQYGAQAKYYLGYMAYQGDDYQQASDLFDAVEGSGRYQEELPYYRADMNFKLGNFKKAIQQGLEQYDQSSGRVRSELAKIIGESYFNLAEYGKAIPYLQSYQGRGGKWTNTDYYQLGYAWYREGDYRRAVQEFSKILDGKDAVAHNAYYHLADSYLKLGEEQQALHAFKQASELSFNEQIQEDAALNYAKLSYSLGNSYQPVPGLIEEFLERYPDNPKGDEMRELLLDSYLSSRNYQAALELLEADRSRGARETLQKLTFYRGLELYNEGLFEQTLDLLDRSLEQPLDAHFVARARYWKAETLFSLGRFAESLEHYRHYLASPAWTATPEQGYVAYNLGYAYFKLRRYQEAIKAFTRYVKEGVDRGRKRDAYLRLGDSHFASRDYWQALENYDEAMAISAEEADYAAFQKAISYGFVERESQKTAILKTFSSTYPQSVYRDDALFELGNSYLNQGNNELALGAYQALESDHPRSTFLARSLLKRALIYNNTDRSDRALQLLKRVASEFSATDEALQAVASAKLIYVDQGQVAAYAQWVATLDFVEVADAELEEAAWQSAEQPYLTNRPDLAVRRFRDYLDQFSDGRHALKANVYLARILYSRGEEDLALPHYRFVLTQEPNAFTEEALVRVAEHYLKGQDFAAALPLLEQLENAADNPQNVLFARSNRMRSCFELERFECALTYAQKVLENHRADDLLQKDAQLIRARAAYRSGNRQTAQKAYDALRASPTSSIAAESLYYLALFANEDGKYEASNALVQELARSYPGFKEIGARGLLLMARNFSELGDAFQASYILESVIENFEGLADIAAEARAQLQAIRAEASKTNASVELEKN